MSANFWCWAPALALLPHSPNFIHRVDEFHSTPFKPASPVIVRFVGSLLKRYPDLSDKEEETAWADGPMMRDANGGFIDFSIRWDYYEKVVPFVTSAAHKLGLSCYDPQTSYYYPATGKPHIIAEYAKVTPVADANSAIQKARYVCALQPNGSGQWRAVLENGSWHVWFGESTVEPTCGYSGALVEQNGTTTSCTISLCKRLNK